jgi:hypothetical protein
VFQVGKISRWLTADDVCRIEPPSRITVVFVLYLLFFQANYRAGLRILEIVDPSKAELVERAYFDVFPADNANQFNGAWSTYPYLPSGNILVSGIEQGLFVLRWNRNGVSTQPTTACQSDAPVVAPTPAPGDCNFGLGIICFLIKILLSILDFVTFWD